MPELLIAGAAALLAVFGMVSGRLLTSTGLEDVEAEYAPDAVHGRRYYEPTRHGAEARYAEVADRVRARLRGEPE